MALDESLNVTVVPLDCTHAYEATEPSESVPLPDKVTSASSLTD